MIIVQNFEDFNDVMAKIGSGQAQVLIVVTCGFFNMYLLNETMGIAIISSAAMCQLEMDPLQRSILRSACLAGLALSAYFMGYLSDQYGRRKILLYTTPICLLISNVSMFVDAWEALAIFRFLLGISLGGVASTIMAYCGEFCVGQRCLSRLVSFMAIFAGLGMIYMPAMGSIIFNQRKIKFPPWRLLGVLNTIPGVVALFLLLLLPESPRYLLAAGKHNDTMSALLWLSLKNHGQSLKEIGIINIDNLIAHVENDKKSLLHHLCCDGLPLFRRPLVQKFMGSFFIHFFVVCITRGLGLWFTEMRVQKVIFRRDETVCSEIARLLKRESEVQEVNCVFKNLLDSILLGVAFLVGYLSIAFLLKFMKPNILFVSCMFISSCFGFILTWVPNKLAIDVSFILFLGFSNIVISLLGSNVVAFAPTHLRGRAMGLCNASGIVGAVLGCSLLGIFLKGNCIYIFNFFAVCPLLAAIFGSFLPF